MNTQEFLQALRSLKESKEALTLSAKEYNKALRELHDAHLAPLVIPEAPKGWQEVPVGLEGDATNTRLTYAQVNWAREHDWYRKVELTVDGYVVTVCEESSGPNGSTSRLIEFTSYKRLRAWAGY